MRSRAWRTALRASSSAASDATVGVEAAIASRVSLYKRPERLLGGSQRGFSVRLVDGCCDIPREDMMIDSKFAALTFHRWIFFSAETHAITPCRKCVACAQALFASA